MTKCLMMTAWVALSSMAFAAQSRATETREQSHDVTCTPTLNSVVQAPFVVHRVEAQTDISNLEEMTQSYFYGNLYFKVAIDSLGNYRIRCNERTPFRELLIAQGRMPESDRLFIDFTNSESDPSARVRLECAENPGRI